MPRRRLLVLIPIALLLAAVVFSGGIGPPDMILVRQCVEIYADGLPREVRVGHVARYGRDLVVQVHHLDWTGELRCALYRDGSLDDVETLNRKMEIHWIEPPMPSSP